MPTEQMQHVDYNGLAVLITAIAGGMSVFAGGVVMPILVYIRQGRIQKQSEDRDKKIDEVHTMVADVVQNERNGH